jgi:hypothetical protein
MASLILPPLTALKEFLHHGTGRDTPGGAQPMTHPVEETLSQERCRRQECRADMAEFEKHHTEIEKTDMKDHVYI